MSQPSLNIFSGSKTLGRVYKEQNQINVSFLEFNTPLSSSASHFSANLGGAKRIMQLQGSHDGTGFTGSTGEEKIADFIYEMEQWINGGTQSLIIYTDSFEKTYYVHAFDWLWVRSNDDPNRILYTLLMIETASIV